MAFCCCTSKNMTKGVADRVDPLEELRRHGLTRSPAPQLQHEETAVPVSINVYSLTPRNRKLRKIGFGIFHTGVVVYGIEWGYGEAVHNPNASGLFYVRPGEAEGSLYKHIQLGYTTKSPAQVDTILHRLENEWRSSEYHILHHNCNHFAQAFCEALSSRERLIIPAWCNRAARISDKVLPQKLATKVQRMLDGLPPTPPVQSQQNNNNNATASINNAEWKERVSGIPVSVVPKYWYLHPSVRQPPRYITKPTPTPLTLSELTHTTSTPLPTPLSAFEKESPAFAHHIRSNTISSKDESSNNNNNNHLPQNNGISGSSVATVQHLHELHVTESNVPAPGQSDSFIVSSNAIDNNSVNVNVNVNTNATVAPETIMFTSSSSASLAPPPVHHLPPPPPPYSRKTITSTERVSLIANEHNEERIILQKMSSANSPRRLPPISPLQPVHTKREEDYNDNKDEDKEEVTLSSDKHVDVNQIDVEEEMNGTQWESAAYDNHENEDNQKSELLQDVHDDEEEERNLYSSVSASSSSDIDRRRRRSSSRNLSYREQLVSNSAGEEVESDEKKRIQVFHDENEIMTVEMDESVKEMSEKDNNNIQSKNYAGSNDGNNNINNTRVKHTIVPLKSCLKQIQQEEEQQEEKINSELLKEKYEEEEEEEEELEEEPHMSRLSHRTSVIATGSSRVSPSHSPTRIAYSTTMRSFISNNKDNNNNFYNNSYSNNKSTIANSAPPVLSLEDVHDVGKEIKLKASNERSTDNNSMFDITQRELNAMFDSVESNPKHKWPNESLLLLESSSLTSPSSASLSFRMREYALQQRQRHGRAESKPEITRYNTFMDEKQSISPTLPVIIHKTQLSEPVNTMHVKNDEMTNSNSNNNNNKNHNKSKEDGKEVFVKCETRSSLHDSCTTHSKRPCYSQDDSLIHVSAMSSTTLLEPTLRRSLSEGNLIEKHASLTHTNKEEQYKHISSNVLESDNTKESESENSSEVNKESIISTSKDNNSNSSNSKKNNECITRNDDNNVDVTADHVTKSTESQGSNFYCHSNLRQSNNSDNSERGSSKHYSWNVYDHDEVELYSPLEYNSSHENEKIKPQARLGSANKNNCKSYSYNITKLNSEEESAHGSKTNAMRREMTTSLISPEPDWEVHDMERERKK